MKISDMESNREWFRKSVQKKFYSGPVHFLFTIGLLFSLIIISLIKLEGIAIFDLLMMTVFFTLIDLSSYVMHRFPMHRKNRYMKSAFKFHTTIHHGLFLPGYMSVEKANDLYMILFPPSLVLFNAVIIIPGIAYVVYLFTNTHISILYAFTSYIYFLFYELIHFSAHSRKNSFLHRVPVIKSLNRNHELHHDPKSFAKNIGIVTTFWDYVFKTKV